MPIWALWAACLTLCLFRALVGAAESALYGTSDLRAKELAAASRRAGGRVLRLKSDREATATALRLGMVLGGFLAAAIGAFVPPRLLDFTRLVDAPELAILSALAGALFVGVLA